MKGGPYTLCSSYFAQNETFQIKTGRAKSGGRCRRPRARRGPWRGRQLALGGPGGRGRAGRAGGAQPARTGKTVWHRSDNWRGDGEREAVTGSQRGEARGRRPLDWVPPGSVQKALSDFRPGGIEKSTIRIKHSRIATLKWRHLCKLKSHKRHSTELWGRKYVINRNCGLEGVTATLGSWCPRRRGGRCRGGGGFVLLEGCVSL